MFNISLFLKVNGDNNGHDEEAFTDVKLEVPGSIPSDDTYDRGERVKGEIAMLSPMQHPQQNTSTSEVDKSRPDELNIKSFVPTKPLPIPTPSREATLTQKLELALGKEIFVYLVIFGYLVHLW